jgi:uncharacterized protein
MKRRKPRQTDTPEQTDLLALLLGAEIARNHYGQFLIARQWYATPSICEPEPRTLRLLLRSASGCPARAVRQAADPTRWLFLDTETTGFAAGAGRYAFLIGMAWWDSGGIQIEQLFMRDPGEEYSILLELVRRIRKRPVLVTFNGKSFDWPLLQTRFRMTRVINAPSTRAHLDLLQPARQIWRLQTGSARLGHLEQSVLGTQALGWSRHEDIESARIPEFYLDYLRGRSVSPLEAVFRHNRMDLRGLAALAGRIFQALSTAERASAGEQGALELYGISRLLARAGECARARALCALALQRGLPQSIERTARAELARLIKRSHHLGHSPRARSGIREMEPQ